MPSFYKGLTVFQAGKDSQAPEEAHQRVDWTPGPYAIQVPSEIFIKFLMGEKYMWMISNLQTLQGGDVSQLLWNWTSYSVSKKGTATIQEVCTINFMFHRVQ